MHSIDKIKPLPKWESPPIETSPLINYRGTSYQMVPTALIEKLRADRENLIWLATGVAAFAVAAAFALIVGAFKPATQVVTVEKPIIVEREKVVPTNCLLFCK